MSVETIARNYAEALFTLGEQHGMTERFAELIDAVAGAMRSSPEIDAMLKSPRIARRDKVRIIGQALGASPTPFRRFVEAVIARGRQGILAEIAKEYAALVDVKFNRVHAAVTVARQPDDRLRDAIAADLARSLGKTVVPAFRVDPAILGGVIVRIGDKVHDGSLRRRMLRLRRQLLKA